jgi:hypothetical protein
MRNKMNKGGCGCNKNLFGGNSGILKSVTDLFKTNKKKVRFSKRSRTYKKKMRNN